MTEPEGTDVLGYDNLYRVVSVRRQVSGQADVVETYGYNTMRALNVNAPETTAPNKGVLIRLFLIVP